MSWRNENRQVSRFLLVGLTLLLPLGFADRAVGQRAEAYEYMSASSPLKNGWTVTTQSVPGRPISTVVTPAPLTAAGANGPGVTLVPTSGQYPNPPAGGLSTTTAGGSWVWVPNQGVGVTPGGAPVITQPTLGITSTNALKPASGGQPAMVAAPAAAGCNCGPQVGAGALAASGVPPYSTGVPTVPFAPPAGLPGTIPTSMTQPNVAAQPSAGSNGATTAYYPYLTGNFQPIVATKNLPPGTYMGRGMFGQPTAYIDGQPMRNLFRYVFP